MEIRPPLSAWLTTVALVGLVASFGKYGSPLWWARWGPLAASIGPHDPGGDLPRLDYHPHDGAGSPYGVLSTLLLRLRLVPLPEQADHVRRRWAGGVGGGGLGSSHRGKGAAAEGSRPGRAGRKPGGAGLGPGGPRPRHRLPERPRSVRRDAGPGRHCRLLGRDRAGPRSRHDRLRRRFCPWPTPRRAAKC